MSKELGYKQVKNVESRRTWDRDYYEAKAKERIEKGDDYQDKDEGGPSRRSHKEEFQPAAAGAAGPAGSARAYLKVLGSWCSVYALLLLVLLQIQLTLAGNQDESRRCCVRTSTLYAERGRNAASKLEPNTAVRVFAIQHKTPLFVAVCPSEGAHRHVRR